MALFSFFKKMLGTNNEADSTEQQAPAAEKQTESKPTEDSNINGRAEQSAGKERQKDGGDRTATYNLIILDESGSMWHVRQNTISGCNETLQNIRSQQQEHPEERQYVSVYSFNTTCQHYIVHNAPADIVGDIRKRDYNPNASTPLFDAVGQTLSELQSLIGEGDAVANVTIITDGYENASRRWSLPAVAKLIAELKEKGWVFTFIGANINVEQAARNFGIDSYMQFEQTDEGMTGMFGNMMESQKAYAMKRRYMEKSEAFQKMDADERRKMMACLNKDYFVERERIAPDRITRLGRRDVFVFGSHVFGRHSVGAALYAQQHFGAVGGQAEGLQGRSYAIPVDGNSFGEMRQAISRFTEFAATNPHLRFMLTAVGTGAAGYTVEQMAPLFSEAYALGNVFVPESFLEYL